VSPSAVRLTFHHQQDTNCFGGGGAWGASATKCFHSPARSFGFQVCGSTEREASGYDICKITLDGVVVASIQGQNQHTDCADPVDTFLISSGSVSLAKGCHIVNCLCASGDGLYHSATYVYFTFSLL
jgi:hypothetical protein